MTIRFSVPAALFAFCCAGPVLAATGEAPAARAETADSGSEIVCRVLKVTGSRLGAKRTCLTRDQWRQQRQDDRQNVESAQTKRYYTDPAG